MNMFKRVSTFLLFATALISSRPAMAQAPDSEQKFDGKLTPGEMNRVLNTAFSNLVTSNKNPGQIATNASLDPVAATFSLKASFPFRPLGKKKEDNSEK